MTPATANPELVRRILAETGVDQTVRHQGWSSYLQTLAEALFEWTRSRLGGHATLLPILARLIPLITIGLAVLVVIVLFLLLLRKALDSRQGRAGRSVAADGLRGSPARPQRDREAWRGELERRLASGDVAATLEALWWWFASSLSSAPVDPSWTSRELLSRCRRQDLAPLASALDRLLYGLERPGVAELRDFAARIAVALP